MEVCACDTNYSVMQAGLKVASLLLFCFFEFELLFLVFMVLDFCSQGLIPSCGLPSLCVILAFVLYLPDFAIILLYFALVS